MNIVSIHCKDTRGFSLVELMVVLSIISVVVALSVPSFALIQVKAARAENQTTNNLIFTYAEAYSAENSGYPPQFDYGLQYLSFGGGLHNFCVPNVVGFSVPDCSKMRYWYRFTPSGQSFLVSSQSLYLVNTSGVPTMIFGRQDGPPTRRCKPYAGYKLYFNDLNYYTQNREHSTHSDATNMLKGCF